MSHFFQNARAKTRLYSLVFFCILTMVIISILGLIGMNQISQSLETVYADRIVPLKQLKEVSDGYSIILVDDVTKVRRDIITIDVALDRKTKYLASIQTHWDAYLNTYLTEEEKNSLRRFKMLLLLETEKSFVFQDTTRKKIKKEYLILEPILLIQYAIRLQMH